MFGEHTKPAASPLLTGVGQMKWVLWDTRQRKLTAHSGLFSVFFSRRMCSFPDGGTLSAQHPLGMAALQQVPERLSGRGDYHH